MNGLNIFDGQWPIGRTSIGRLLLLCCVMFSIAANPKAARNAVRDGVAKFKAKKYVQAEGDFVLAAENAPNNHRIKFDLGCASAALMKAEKAKKFYREAAMSRETAISADAHYNLSCFEADQAKEIFGEDPPSAKPAEREAGVELLTSAILHCRDSLRVNPQHKQARHNLEVMRLWLKQMQAVWAERDRQSRRDEKDLLAFLEYIETEQVALRQLAKNISDEQQPGSHRAILKEAESRQQLLSEEIGPLEAKLQEAVSTTQSQPGQAPPAQNPDPQQKEALEKIFEVTGEIRAKMEAATAGFADKQPATAIPQQTDALSLINNLYYGIAPFPQLVSRGLKEQQKLLASTQDSIPSPVPTDDQSLEDQQPDDQSSEDQQPDDQSSDDQQSTANDQTTDDPQAADDDSDANSTSAKDEPGSTSVASAEDQRDNEVASPIDAEISGIDQDELIWQQERLQTWTRALQGKAELMRKSIDRTSQDAADPAGNTPSNDPDPLRLKDDPEPVDPAQNPPPPNDSAATIGGPQPADFLPAIEKAIELSPELVSVTGDATQVLQQAKIFSDLKDAVTPQTRAKEIWEEIAKLMPKDDQQDQQNQQDEDPKPEDESPDENPDPNDQQQENDQEEQKKKSQEQDDSQNQKSQSQNMSEDKAEALMREARERERKYREARERIRVQIMKRSRVDKDW